MQCHFVSGKAPSASTAPSIPHTPAMSCRQHNPPGAMQCLSATSRCGLKYNPRGAHLVTSLSWQQRRQSMHSIFSLFWASPLLLPESKPQLSSSQREEQWCWRWAHRTVPGVGKELAGCPIPPPHPIPQSSPHIPVCNGDSPWAPTPQQFLQPWMCTSHKTSTVFF